MVGQAKWTTTNHTKGCLNPQKVLLCIWGGIRMESTIMSPSEKLGFPCNSAGKQSACNVEDVGSICGLGRSPGEGKDYPLHYCDLENSVDYKVHGIAKSWTRLSDFHFTSLLPIRPAESQTQQKVSRISQQKVHTVPSG